MSEIIVEEKAEPNAPSAGQQVWYTDIADNITKAKDSAGNVRPFSPTDFGTEFEFLINNNVVSNSGNGSSNIKSVATINTKPPGTYKVTCNFNYKPSTTGGFHRFQLRVDGVEIGPEHINHGIIELPATRVQKHMTGYIVLNGDIIRNLEMFQEIIDGNGTLENHDAIFEIIRVS